MVLHELNLAARYADHLIAMRDGVVSAVGAPADVITRDGGARGLRHGLPGHRRPRLAHPDGRARGTALPRSTPPPAPLVSNGATRMTTQSHPDLHRPLRPRRRGPRRRRRATQPGVRAGHLRRRRRCATSARPTASTRGSRWSSPARPACCRSTARCRRSGRPPGSACPTRSARPCAPTRSARSAPSGDTVQLVADFVVHEPDDGSHGRRRRTSGPRAAGRWRPSRATSCTSSDRTGCRRSTAAPSSSPASCATCW